MKAMILYRDDSKKKIVDAIHNLIPGDPNSFLILEIRTKRIEAVQAYRNSADSFHVEILRKGHNISGFGGIRILSREDVPLDVTLLIFLGIAEAGDTSTISKHYGAFKDSTTRLLNKRNEARFTASDAAAKEWKHLSKNASEAEIIKAIGDLEHENVNSFLILQIDTDEVDSIQVKQTKENLYHVEILRRVEDPKSFHGIRIFAADNLNYDQTIKLFLSIRKTGNTSEVDTSAFKDTTARIRAAWG